MRNLQLNLPLQMLKLQLIARLQLCKMPLRKAVLCWKLQIARDVLPNKNLLTPMRHLQTLEMSTNQLLLQRGNWNQNSTSLGLIWMRRADAMETSSRISVNLSALSRSSLLPVMRIRRIMNVCKRDRPAPGQGQELQKAN